VIIVTVFVLLAVFSIVSLMMTTEDAGSTGDPRNNPFLWELLGPR
jgi:hypothetical protein